MSSLATDWLPSKTKKGTFLDLVFIVDEGDEDEEEEADGVAVEAVVVMADDDGVEDVVGGERAEFESDFDLV